LSYGLGDCSRRRLVPFALDVKGYVLINVEYVELGFGCWIYFCNRRPYLVIGIGDGDSRDFGVDRGSYPVDLLY